MKPRLLLATAVALAAFASPAVFQPAVAREQLTDEEMDDARGGILVAGNVAFEFGAVMKTYEDGVLALQTQVNWTAAGQQVTQTLGPDVSAGELGALNPASTATLAGLTKSTPTSFTTSDGATLIQQIAPTQVLNLLANTGSDHTYQLDTAVTLVLPGFASTQANMVQDLAALHIAQEVTGLMSSAAH